VSIVRLPQAVKQLLDFLFESDLLDEEALSKVYAWALDYALVGDDDVDALCLAIMEWYEDRGPL